MNTYHKTSKNGGDICYLSIAGYIVKIESFCSYQNIIHSIRKFYNNCIITKKPDKIDYQIIINNENKILLLRRKNNRLFYIDFFKLHKNKITVNFASNPLYFEIIFRYMLLELLSKDNGFLLHAAGNIIHDKVVLFSGSSGVGKSTIMTILSDNYELFVDDIVCVRRIHNKYYAFRTPFIRKNTLQILGAKPYLINGLYFLEREKSSRIFALKDSSLIAQKLLSELWAETEYVKYLTKTIYRFAREFTDVYTFELGPINTIAQTFDNHIKIVLNE